MSFEKDSCTGGSFPVAQPEFIRVFDWAIKVSDIELVAVTGGIFLLIVAGREHSKIFKSSRSAAYWLAKVIKSCSNLTKIGPKAHVDMSKVSAVRPCYSGKHDVLIHVSSEMHAVTAPYLISKLCKPNS